MSEITDGQATDQHEERRRLIAARIIGARLSREVPYRYWLLGEVLPGVVASAAPGATPQALAGRATAIVDAALLALARYEIERTDERRQEPPAA